MCSFDVDHAARIPLSSGNIDSSNFRRLDLLDRAISKTDPCNVIEIQFDYGSDKLR